MEKVVDWRTAEQSLEGLIEESKVKEENWRNVQHYPCSHTFCLPLMNNKINWKSLQRFIINFHTAHIHIHKQNLVLLISAHLEHSVRE